MAKKLMAWKTRGMNRDLSVSAFNPEFAFENRNLRLGTNESNTMMSWVNEKGTERIPLVMGNWVSGDDSTRTSVTEITGTPIGTAVINHQLVVFTTDTLHNTDYIYVLKYANTSKTSMLCKMLFGGDNASLGFDIAHPIETLVSYEAKNIQKVYWVDGINQPRVINIEGNIRGGNSTQFDFVPTLQLQEEVTVKKMLGANGMFAPGVIQYAFTYYTRYGQESSIFYTTPLQYISYRDRGGSPEDRIENAFKITVVNVDMNFDYLRIYSIQRTSIDATPVCKRIQDICLNNLQPVIVEDREIYKVSYTDTGLSGETVDPTELLYKGGEEVAVHTLEQKDNTLFLGNISIKRPEVSSAIKAVVKADTLVTEAQRDIQATSVSTGSYVYANQLTSLSLDGSRTVPCAGFKYGDVYRLGVQFQYKTGKWSEPIWIKDERVNARPELNIDNVNVKLPVFAGSIGSDSVASLIQQGYRKIRGLVVFPNIQDRNILCQGVVNPTMYTDTHRIIDRDLYAQSSWFFRASNGGAVGSDCSVSPKSTGTLEYTSRGIASDTPAGCDCYKPYTGSLIQSQHTDHIRQTEIQGDFEDNNKYKIDRDHVVTFHSPDVEFDDQMALTDYSSSEYKQVGYARFTGTLANIEIQTETPASSSLGGGFVHKSFTEQGTKGIISGLFFDDCVIDEGSETGIRPYPRQESSCKWMVYLWNRSGALNNDINRPSDKGTMTAKLLKKTISNMRFANTVYSTDSEAKSFLKDPQIFSGEENHIIKLGNEIYMGNVDTSLMPDHADGDYFAYNGSDITAKFVTTPFTSNIWWKTFNFKGTIHLPPPLGDHEINYHGLFKYNGSNAWLPNESDIGDSYMDLVIKKSPVRMKYKSSPHLVFEQYTGGIDWEYNDVPNILPIVEITQSPSDETRFGGTSVDAFKENVWLPAGDPVLLTATDEFGRINFRWDYGDTYFQRWDCLKTYAYTNEDPNQVIEIGSFMLETRTNIDGRYDTNRGQMNNLYVNSVNFNKMNPVYSQKDNFFQYRIMDDSFYENTVYPNQITWSKTKSSGADTDLWTNMTLASTLELDGNKGEVTSLQRLNDQLLCFQNSGISQIMYNGNVMIESSQGVPIEIANSGKVQGKNYLSDTVGCSNKWSIVAGTGGLYFMDSDAKSINLFNGQLTSISLAGGFNAWSKMHIPSHNVKWTPTFPLTEDKSAFVSYYDRINQEVLFISKSHCLAWSEKFQVFTSFYDYNSIPFFCNLDDTGIWLRANQLWKHQSGDYCRFFGASRPYSMILVGNPEPQADKIFTNLEFRASVDNDGVEDNGTFTPYLPFDSLDTWNEYQHGVAYLNNMRGQTAMKHHTGNNEASLKRKFRIWRCDIPRDNGDNVDTFDETFDDTFHPLSRGQKHPMDRMRNPWLYLRLRKDEDSSNRRAEIHDILMTYFD